MDGIDQYGRRLMECDCSAGDACPQGRVGSERRCRIVSRTPPPKGDRIGSEVELTSIVLQPAEESSPLRMYAVDRGGRLWTRVKGSAGWGEWRRDINPDKALSGYQ